MAINIKDSLGLTGFSFGSLSLWGTLLIVFFIIIMIFALVGGIIVFIVWNKSYNQKVELWAKVNGVPQRIATYKAKWIKIAGKHSNEKLLYVRTVQRWEFPRLMAGKNNWIFWRREQDNEWINILPEDVDEQSKTMKVKFTDGDVRMQRVANEKVLRDRLQKKKNWMEIIAQIGYIIVFIFLILGLVVLFTQLKDLSASMETSSKAIEKMAESVNRFYEGKEGGLSPADRDQQGNSGLVPVGEQVV